jgi:peptidylprolyl isomerase
MIAALNRCLKGWLKTTALALLLAVLLIAGSTNRPAFAEVLISRLPQGNAITDGRALLRYALPIDNTAVRQLQTSLEDLSTPLRVGRGRLSGVNSYLTQAERILTNRQKDLLDSIPEDRKAEAGFLIAATLVDLTDMRSAVEQVDKKTIWAKRQEALNKVGRLEELMVQQFPFEVPEEYNNLPQLKGRATIDIKTNKGDMTLVVDGYSAPVTAGNFVDLVKRGFYDGLQFTRKTPTSCKLVTHQGMKWALSTPKPRNIVRFL